MGRREEAPAANKSRRSAAVPGFPARQQVAGGGCPSCEEGGNEGGKKKKKESQAKAEPARCAAGPVDYNWGREGAFASRWWAAGSGGEHEGGRMGASNGKQYGSEGKQREGGSRLGDIRSSGADTPPRRLSPARAPIPRRKSR